MLTYQQRQEIFHRMRRAGLSTRAANVLANQECATIESIAALGIMHFLCNVENCGWKTTREIGALIGRDWSRYGEDYRNTLTARFLARLKAPAEDVTIN